MDRFSLPPIPRSENPDLLVPPREAYRHDGALNSAKTKIALLSTAVIKVLGNHA